MDPKELAAFVNEAIDIDAKQWIGEQLDQEVKRLQTKSVRPIPMSLMNAGLYVESIGKRSAIVNRAEIHTAFDFDKIQQLMVSEPVSYPGKEGYLYVNVLLWTDKPLPLILPYLYDSKYRADSDKEGGRGQTVENTLTEWNFINQLGKSSRHRIKQFEE